MDLDGLSVSQSKHVTLHMQEWGTDVFLVFNINMAALQLLFCPFYLSTWDVKSSFFRDGIGEKET